MLSIMNKLQKLLCRREKLTQQSCFDNQIYSYCV